MTPPPSPATEGHAAQTPPPLALDWRKYADLLDDPSIPEEQKRQLIEAIWQLLSGIIDMQFGFTLPRKDQEYNAKNARKYSPNIVAKPVAGQVRSEEHIMNNNNKAASALGPEAAGA